MNKKGFSGILIILIAVVAVAVTTFLFFNKQGTPSVKISTDGTGIASSTNNFAATSTTAVNRPSPGSNVSNQQIPKGWQTLMSDKYEFQIAHPTTSTYGGLLFNSECKNPLMSGPTLFDRMKCLGDLFMVRGGGEDQQWSMIMISATEKSPYASLDQWVTVPNPNLHVENIPSGDISSALEKAYAKSKEIYENAAKPGYVPPADEFVAFNKKEENSISIFEIGAIVQGGGRLSYTTLLTNTNSKYVYSIELLLEYSEAAKDFSDNQFIDVYKQMIKSFVVSP